MSNNNPILTLNLNEKQALLHKSFYQQQIDRLRQSDEVKEYIEYMELLRSIDSLIGEKSSSPRVFVSHSHVEGTGVVAMDAAGETEPSEVYSKEWPLAKKAEYAIHSRGKMLNTREIIEVIVSYEPDYYKEKVIDFDRFQKNLGSTLKQKIDNKKTFFRQQLTGKLEYVYGLIAEKEKYKNAKNEVNLTTLMLLRNNINKGA